ncbi:MAG: hypothetical protein MUO34_09210 [Ignavibacteriaceae bacterium]|nr:hypothetical protein [Ignavibacteriaceae bacterium]
MKIFLFILPFLILSSISCSGSKEVNNVDVEVKILEVNAWLNLMPGFSPGSFHLSGEFAVYSDTNNVIMDVKLEEILVYSNDELLYDIKPVFKYSRNEPDYSLSPKNIEVYQFYNESELEIKEVLMANNLINVEIKFIVEDEEINLTIDDVEVTRAY